MPNYKEIIELSIENGVCYKMYLPFKQSDGATGWIQGQILDTKKPFEYELLLHTLTQIPKNATIVDIGANIGNHSLFWAANGFRVYAFEANAIFSAAFKQSIALNGFEKSITLYECGLSDKEERLYFQNEFDITLSAIDDESKGKSAHFIDCRSIDSFDIQDTIALVKIDVEGMESKVIKGMEQLIAKNRPIIYAEAACIEDFLAVDRVLSGLNYVLLTPLNLWTMQVYYPMEQVNLHQMLQRNLSNTAMLGVLWGNRKQDNSFIHGKLAEISHRLEHSYITRRLRRIKNSILKRLKG